MSHFSYSIIIPVYNVAPFLRNCLDSVVRAAGYLSTGCELEVLCIDDGSTDNSGHILDQYAQSYMDNGNGLLSFVVRHQENQGVSVARNMALDLAHGDWLVFLDPDDRMSENLLLWLSQQIDKYPAADVFGYGTQFCDERGRLLSLWKKQREQFVTDGDGVLLDGEFTGAVWDKAVRRELIEQIGLRFVPGLRHGEDSIFAKIYLAYAHQCVMTPKLVGTVNTCRSGSAFHSRSESLFRYAMEAYGVYKLHLIRTRSRGILYVFRCLLKSFPAIGCGYGDEVRQASIESLLSSKKFMRKVLADMLRYGTIRLRCFVIMFSIPNRRYRRFLIKHMARFVEG